jgi:hypothetical protein
MVIFIELTLLNPTPGIFSTIRMSKGEELLFEQWKSELTVQRDPVVREELSAGEVSTYAYSAGRLTTMISPLKSLLVGVIVI